jgi:hypothetical protein
LRTIRDGGQHGRLAGLGDVHLPNDKRQLVLTHTHKLDSVQQGVLSVMSE